MGSASLFAQLDLGKRSLMAQQAGIQVAGHNVANVNNENYSRQRVDLDPQHPVKSRFGTGVDVKTVERMSDRFITGRLIGEQSRGGSLEVRANTLARLENLFNDTEGLGLRSALNNFWNAWGELANQPESQIHRKEVINSAKGLAERFHGVAADLKNIREELNGRIAGNVEKVNQLAGQLAELNTLLQQVDRGGGEANDVRDEREGTLRELAKLVQIEWFEDDDRLVNVNIGNGWPLVLGRNANHIEASFDHEEVGLFSIRGIDPRGISRDLTGILRTGQLAELVDVRDEVVVGFMDQMDLLASELAFRVNRLHTTGTGINSPLERLRSSFALKPDARDKPLPFVRDGLFRIHLVGDGNEILETYEIEIRAGRDTIHDIVARINRAVGDPAIFQAALLPDGSVALTAKNLNRFILGADETDFPVVMGFNNFFENLQGAKDIRINQRLEENPNQISTGNNLKPGENSVAQAIHGLQFVPTMAEESATFDEFYNGVVAELGLRINRNQAEQHNQNLVIDQFRRMRDEFSSVNMDEEVADMVQFQRGFQASAKFISTVDEMTRTVVSM